MGGTGRGDRRHIGRSEVCVLYGKYLLTADNYAGGHLERDSISSSSMLALKTVGSQDVSGCFSPRRTQENTTRRCVGRALRSGLSLSYSPSLSWIMPRITGKL